jgi:phytanoyl-CoA hydroxylase
MPQLHRLNRGFAWREVTTPLRLLRPEQRRAFEREGYLVLPGAVSPDELAKLTAALDRCEAETEAQLRTLREGDAFIARADEITFSTHLVKRTPVAREFVCAPFFRDLTHDLLGPDVRLYWDQAVYKKPGAASPFPWHQDNGYTFVEPQQYLTCWVALTDAGEDNGCLWVQPGGHVHGTLLHRLTPLGHVCFETSPPGAIPLPARAGTVVVMSAITPHCTGPNRTTATRKAYIIQYAPEGAYSVTLEDGQPTRRPCRAKDWQFAILSGGR